MKRSFKYSDYLDVINLVGRLREIYNETGDGNLLDMLNGIDDGLTSMIIEHAEKEPTPEEYRDYIKEENATTDRGN